MKIIIFDSSTIINFALNGILDVLENLKKVFPGKFIITQEVKKEIIDQPLTNKRYELEALQIKRLFDTKVLELPISIQIKDENISKKTREILNYVNHSFSAKNNFIHLIDNGEASCVALSLICEEKKIENVFSVDERTMRMLCESPLNLKKLLEMKLHTTVSLKNNFNILRNIKCIRSSELVFLAYKKKLVQIKGNNVLDALLYAVKFKGTSISESEIFEIKKIAKTI
jgi:predicted nucleic acid-binding protein